MRAEVAKDLQLRRDMHRLIPVLAKQRGYTIAEVPVAHHARRFGESKYGLERFHKGARDALLLWIEAHTWTLRIAGGAFFAAAIAAAAAAQGPAAPWLAGACALAGLLSWAAKPLAQAIDTGPALADIDSHIESEHFG